MRKFFYKSEPIIVLRGDTLSQSQRLGNISGRAKLWFTVKTDHNDEDADAMIKVEETAGLEVINGAVAGTPANGAISVTGLDLAAVRVEAVEMAKLASVSGIWFYDWQVQDAAGNITTLVRDRFVLHLDVTQAVASSNPVAGAGMLWPEGDPVLWPVPVFDWVLWP